MRRALLRFDVENLKTVLRGLTQGVAPEMIVDAIIPLSNLKPAEWIDLAQSGNARQAVDQLASWQAALAQPLLTTACRAAGCQFVPMGDDAGAMAFFSADVSYAAG